jgi:hypothetical protein
MATMVAEPYVNHIPTLTGGVGARQLERFYQHHFVHGNPEDMRMIPISRTVGALQVVDEFIMCFTHDREIDWLLPGVAPTGKYVEIPMADIISFRGDKLYHEHIYCAGGGPSGWSTTGRLPRNPMRLRRPATAASRSRPCGEDLASSPASSRLRSMTMPARHFSDISPHELRSHRDARQKP